MFTHCNFIKSENKTDLQQCKTPVFKVFSMTPVGLSFHKKRWLQWLVIVEMVTVQNAG